VRGDNVSELKSKLNRKLRSGDLLRFFIRHLETQGSSASGLKDLFDFRQTVPEVQLKVSRSGHWLPPNAISAKKWMKSAQAGLDSAYQKEPALKRQVGVRWLVEPGSKVEVGMAVVAVRIPFSHSCPPLNDLAGDVIDAMPSAYNRGVIEMI
jgi:hypothetical protein